MSSFVLDTNVVSGLMRSDPGPSSRLLELTPDDVLVPQPVIAEIRYGLGSSGHGLSLC